MTINSETRVAGPFDGNDSTVSFPFTFKVFDSDEVRVVAATGAVETDLALGTDYTVTLNADQNAAPGGSVVLAAPLATGTRLTLTSALEMLQPVDLTNQGGFYPRVINSALDRLTILLQQLASVVSRTLKFPLSDGPVGDLPGRSVRAGTVLAFDEATGEPVAGPDISSVNGVAGALVAINTVADNIVDVNTVADNLVDVSNFSGVYYGASATDPTTRRDGSPLQAGDLYFSTFFDALRTYNGIAWRASVSGVVTVQNLSGNGVQTQFPLNYAPESEAITHVFIGGAYQQKNTYELGGANGDVLIFNEAPPVGTDNIEVVVSSLTPSDDKLRQDLAGSSGAGLVGYGDATNYPMGTTGARLRGVVTVESFGASPDNPDNTGAYNALIASVPEGTLVRWGRPGETYVGNFVSATKALRCDLNGAILQNASDNVAVIAIGSLGNAVAHNVVESTIIYGATTFRVVGASGLFAVGDIGYLWDGAVRPTGGNVNFEVVKIKAIAGDLVTVEGFIASYKGAGPIRFYRDPNQLKDAAIFNGKIRPTPGHYTFGAAVLNCDGVVLRDIKTEGTTGDAVASRYSYNVKVSDIETSRPNATGSGQGYGVALFGVSRFSVDNVSGMGMRHVFDQDSAYFGRILGIDDVGATSAPVILAHNGFAGHIHCSAVRCDTVDYSVVLLEQGYGGAVNAQKGNHPFRNILIDGVDITMRSAATPNSSLACVYFQNSVVDCSVDAVAVRFTTAETPTANAGSAIVRVDGIAKGKFEVTNISANKVGMALRSNGNKGSLTGDKCVTKLDGVSLGECAQVVLLQGDWSLSTNDITCQSAPAFGRLVTMEGAYGGTPSRLHIGDAISYAGGDIPLALVSGVLAGSMPRGVRSINTGLPVVDGQSITQAEVQNKSAALRLIAPVGTGTTTTLSASTALPPPVVEGQELTIVTAAGRNSVAIPGGATASQAVTVPPGGAVRYVASGGLWRPVGLYSVA